MAIAGVVVKARFVGGFGANTDNSCGVVGNVPVVEGGAGRPDKHGRTMDSFVLGGLREDGQENGLHLGAIKVRYNLA